MTAKAVVPMVAGATASNAGSVALPALTLAATLVLELALAVLVAARLEEGVLPSWPSNWSCRHDASLLPSIWTRQNWTHRVEPHRCRQRLQKTSSVVKNLAIEVARRLARSDRERATRRRAEPLTWRVTR